MSLNSSSSEFTAWKTLGAVARHEGIKVGSKMNPSPSQGPSQGEALKVRRILNLPCLQSARLIFT